MRIKGVDRMTKDEVWFDIDELERAIVVGSDDASPNEELLKAVRESVETASFLYRGPQGGFWPHSVLYPIAFWHDLKLSGLPEPVAQEGQFEY